MHKEGYNSDVGADIAFKDDKCKRQQYRQAESSPDDAPVAPVTVTPLALRPSVDLLRPDAPAPAPAPAAEKPEAKPRNIPCSLKSCN